jgi:glycine dehydrogenase subunit 1
LRRVAALNHAAAVDLAERLGAIEGVSVVNDAFFNEFTIRTPRAAAGLIDELAARGIIGGLPVSRLAPRAGLDDLIVVAATEVSTPADRQAYAEALAQCLQTGGKK